MLVKNAENYIYRLKKIITARFGNIETAITHDDDCDMHAVQISFTLNDKYSWVCAYEDDDVITYYVSGKGRTKEMIIEDTQVKSMYKVLDKVEDLAYEPEEIKESTYRDRLNHFMEAHSFPSISEMYNDKCFCCVADRKGNECKGKETCSKTWKRYEAITNPEWHHVSLATLTNLDFDMLDRKRQVYLKAHRELKRTLADLSKCKTGHAYEARARKFFRDMKSKYYRNVISHEMRKYLYLQLSMSNVTNGVWSSYVEPAMGLHESRRYSRPTLPY